METHLAHQEKQHLFEDLKNLEPAAIRKLASLLENSFRHLPGVYLLPKEDIEELRNDTILVTLQKITEGTFLFQNCHPLAYAQAVARGLLSNRLRKKKHDTVPLENFDVDGFDPELFFAEKETAALLEKLLAELGGTCEQLIRLRYYDNLRDEDVVQQQLAPYSTVDSLKNKRCQCLKKLSGMARRVEHLFQ